MTSKSYPTKTFQQQHNITLIKQTYTKDVLQLTHNNWAYLYQQMKLRGLNVKQLRKNMTKYDRDVISLIESSHFFYFDKVTFSRISMKQKLTQYNNQLRIRISQLFQFIAMLHLQDLSSTVQFMYTSLIGVIESIVDSVQDLKQSNYRLQKQLQDWKLKKKNVLCFSCRKNIQQAKLRNLATEMSQTISEQVPNQLIDQQHKVKRIQNQCKNLQLQLNAMSEQHFFNSQSDNLIQLINQVLKARISLGDKNDRKQNTTTVISKCLNDVSEMLKPLQIDFTPLQTMNQIETSKKINNFSSAYSSQVLSIKDLGDGQQYVNKLKTLFSEPLHRFIEKYQSIIEAKYKNVTTRSRVQQSDQQTQTSLVKQPQYVKNLQKQVNFLTKQLTSIKASKQNSQKQIMRVMQVLQKNQSKMIQIVARNRLIEIQNSDLINQNGQLKNKFKALQKQHQSQKDSLFKNFTAQKSNFLKQISCLEQQLKQLKKDNLQRQVKHKLQTKGVQTFNTLLGQMKEYLSIQIQTDQIYIKQKQQSQLIMSSRKNLFKTLKNIRLKSSATNQFDQNQFLQSIVSSGGNVFSIKKNHLKSRSQIPIIIDQNSQTGRVFIQEDKVKINHFNNGDGKMMRTAPLGSNPYSRQCDGFQPFEGSLNYQQQIIDQQRIRKMLMIRKNRKPSINSMIPESKQNSRSYLTNSKFSHQKDSDFVLKQSQSIMNSTQRDRNIFNYGHQQQELRIHDGIHGQSISNSSSMSKFHKSQKSHLSLCEKNREKRSQLTEQFLNANNNNNDNILLLQNFNDISNILSSSAKTNRESMLMSKLKKLPKNQIKQKIGRQLDPKRKVIKNVMKNSNNHNINSSSDDITQSRQSNELIIAEMKHIHYYQSCQPSQNIIPINHHHNNNNSTTKKDSQQTFQRKQFVKLIVDEKFDYLNSIGLIHLIEQVEQDPKDIIAENEQHNKNQTFREKFRKARHQQKQSHIHKCDLQLFFSLQQASRYQNNSGLWSQLQSCIMVDNNFSKMAQQIDRYFQHLKSTRKNIFNEYLLFLQEPFKFMKEIVDDKNQNIQKQKVVKKIARLEKLNCGVERKDLLREIFRKLIRLHKAVHKNGCRHIEKFLKKIGFYQWKEKELNERQQIPVSNMKELLRQSSTSNGMRKIKN